MTPNVVRLASRILSRGPSGSAAIVKTATTRTRNPAGRLAGVNQTVGEIAEDRTDLAGSIHKRGPFKSQVGTWHELPILQRTS
jgi:hypothetical protein